jgi:hypothetical protein
VELASILAAKGDKQGSKELLEECLLVFEKIGEPELRSKAEEELRGMVEG